MGIQNNRQFYINVPHIENKKSWESRDRLHSASLHIFFFYSHNSRIMSVANAPTVLFLTLQIHILSLLNQFVYQINILKSIWNSSSWVKRMNFPRSASSFLNLFSFFFLSFLLIFYIELALDIFIHIYYAFWLLSGLTLLFISLPCLSPSLAPFSQSLSQVHDFWLWFIAHLV